MEFDHSETLVVVVQPCIGVLLISSTTRQMLYCIDMDDGYFLVFDSIFFEVCENFSRIFDTQRKSSANETNLINKPRLRHPISRIPSKYISRRYIFTQ